MVFYAVANGRTNGIFNTWDECNTSIKGYKSAVYKKFDTKTEAELFISEKSNTSIEISENMFIPDYYVYTDGSCINNGKPNAMAGLGIYFGENDPRNLSQRVEGKQTNNTGELSAIIRLYKIIENDILSGRKIAIVSDSEYAIKCVSSYGEKCSKDTSTKEIPNKELVKCAYELYKNKSNVQFIHIMAHTGNTDIHSIGNEGADKLANQAIGLESCPYSENPVKSIKIYINVPFSKKDEAKALGAKWDANQKKWYIYENTQNKDSILSKFA